jgi:hypothetical protein
MMFRDRAPFMDIINIRVDRRGRCSSIGIDQMFAGHGKVDALFKSRFERLEVRLESVVMYCNICGRDRLAKLGWSFWSKDSVSMI